jgi:hypothetical protein
VIDTAWIALIGTVVGGAGLKVIEKALSRGGDQVDLATKMRAELRSEVTTLKEEIRHVEKDLDLWKEKYFLLLQDYLEVKSKVDMQKKPKGGDEW